MSSMQYEPIYGHGLCECGCGRRTSLARHNQPSRGWVKGEPLRFIKGHGSRMRGTPAEQLWTKVDRRDADECWPYTGKLNHEGYGRLMVREGDDVRTIMAHRLAYELEVGPIPEGLCIDHLCRNRACCNPRHMEPVTPGENALRGVGALAQYARQTHCIHGHPFAGDNLLVSPNGARRCRACRRRWGRERMARKRAERNATT